MGTFTRIEPKAPAERQKALQSGTFTRVATDETITGNTAPERAKAGRGGSFVKISAPAGAVPTLTGEQAAGGSRNDNAWTAAKEVPTQQNPVDWLEQQRAEWMEPISQGTQFPQLPQLPQFPQPALPAVPPACSMPEMQSNAGQVMTPKAEEPPSDVPENPNAGFFSRLGNTVSGIVKESLSKHMGAQRALYQGSQKTRIDNYADMLALEQVSADREYRGLVELLAKDGLTVGVFEGMPEDDGFFSDDQREYLLDKGVRNPDNVLASFRLWQSASQKADAYRQSIDVQPKAAKAARELAETVRQSGAENIERAKDGLGGFGQSAVDVSAVGGQMLMDKGLGAVTGTGANVPLAIRTFGEAAQEAWRNGANMNQQMLNGFGSAGIAVGMGELPNVSNFLQDMLDQNTVNKFVEGLVKKYGATAAAQMMRRFSQSEAGRIALPALRDGIEASAADVFRFFLKKAGYDPDAQFDVRNAWYDFLAAAGLGGFGKMREPLGNAANQTKGTQASFWDQLLESLEEDMWKYLEWKTTSPVRR